VDIARGNNLVLPEAAGFEQGFAVKTINRWLASPNTPMNVTAEG
jgi:hypothetical protein